MLKIFSKTNRTEGPKNFIWVTQSQVTPQFDILNHFKPYIVNFNHAKPAINFKFPIFCDEYLPMQISRSKKHPVDWEIISYINHQKLFL